MKSTFLAPDVIQLDLRSLVDRLDTLSEFELRIAAAKTIGIAPRVIAEFSEKWSNNEYSSLLSTARQYRETQAECDLLIPDFLNDLNAMHQVEDDLGLAWPLYIHNLKVEIAREKHPGVSGFADVTETDLVHAKPKCKLKAFLRTSS